MIVEANGKVRREMTGKERPILIAGYASTPRVCRGAQLFRDSYIVTGCDLRGKSMEPASPHAPTRSTTWRTSVSTCCGA